MLYMFKSINTIKSICYFHHIIDYTELLYNRNFGANFLRSGKALKAGPYVHLICLIIWGHFLNFWHSKNILDSSYVFLRTSLKSSIKKKFPGSFYQRVVYRKQDLGILIVTDVSQPPVPSADEATGKKSFFKQMYELKHIYIQIHIRSICINQTYIIYNYVTT